LLGRTQSIAASIAAKLDLGPVDPMPWSEPESPAAPASTPKIVGGTQAQRSEPESAAPAVAAPHAEVRSASPTERQNLENWRSELERRDGTRADRRQSDRRGMDQLRSEALRTLITRVEDRNFGGLRNRVNWPRRISPSRIALLVVALMAGGLAAFLATQHEQPAPVVAAPAPEVAKAPMTQILVAKAAFAVGQRLTADALQWQDWPDTALRPEYVTEASAPDAITKMAGSTVRSEIFAGEPIRAQKLGSADGGYLSAVLDKGMRGVSVSVAAESASGGFVVPDDHVDVVLTRDKAESKDSDSQTILSNVRVLAINARLGNSNDASASAEATDPASQVFSSAIATLELNPAQAEVIINATSLGKLSLMLRSNADTTDASAAQERETNAAIRMSSPFWAN
jgi:pilus assembly protein CpaB